MQAFTLWRLWDAEDADNSLGCRVHLVEAAAQPQDRDDYQDDAGANTTKAGQTPEDTAATAA